MFIRKKKIENIFNKLIITINNFSSWNDIKRNFGPIELYKSQLQVPIVFLFHFRKKLLKLNDFYQYH